MVYKNGGFPPIIYCEADNKDPLKKDRFYSSNPQQKQTISIRKLLKDNIKKPLIQEYADNTITEVAEL
jgi:hypothetical protein